MYRPSIIQTDSARSARSRIALGVALTLIVGACSSQADDVQSDAGVFDSTTSPSTTTPAPITTTVSEPEATKEFLGTTLNSAFEAERLGQGFVLSPGLWSSNSLDVPVAFETDTELILLNDQPGTIRVGLPDFRLGDADTVSDLQNSFLLVSPSFYSRPPETPTGAGSLEPVPDNVGDYLAEVNHVEVLASGEQETPGGVVPWWEIVSSNPPGLGFACEYGPDCGGIHVDKAQALQHVPNGDNYRLKVFQIPTDDGDLHLLVEGSHARFGEIEQRALSVLDSLQHSDVAAPPPGPTNQFGALIGSRQLPPGQWFSTIAGNDVRFTLETAIEGVGTQAATATDLIINAGPGELLVIKQRNDFVQPEFAGIEGGYFPTGDMLLLESPTELSTWLNDIEYIRVTDTGELTLAGIAGQYHDVVLNDGYSFNELVDCGPAVVCATLFRTRNSSVAVDELSIVRIVDLPDVNLLIIVAARTNGLAGWLTQLAPVLDSLTIEPLTG